MLSANERNATLQSVILAAVDAGSKRMRCACPGIVQAWNANTQTVSVKLAIKEVLKTDGTNGEVEIPMLVDVPVVMPRAGGYCLLMVPRAGDECLVVFSDMCIDSWWQSGGVQSQAEFRRHDLSDGFAVLGCWSQVKRPTFPTGGMRLQNDNGTAYVAIDDTGVHFLNADFGIRDLYTSEYGVAVGQNSTGTRREKKFEVAQDHMAYFNGDAMFLSGFTSSGISVFYDSTYFKNGATFEGEVTTTVIWNEISNAELNGVAWDESSDEAVMYAKNCGVVHLQGIVYPTSSISGSSTKTAIFTLPEGYRPEHKIMFSVPTSVNECILTINTDGTADLFNLHSSSLTTGTYISVACQFIAA